MNNPIMNAPEKRKNISLYSVYIGIIAMMFLTSVKSTLLPVAAMEIGGTEIYSMVNTIMGVVGICFMPLYGNLCYKKPALKLTLFKWSFLISAVSCVLCAMAGNMYFLIIVSVLQAPLSAGIFVCGYGLISEMFDRQKAGTCLGMCGMSMSLGMVIAPILGGLIIQYTSWRVIFGIAAVLYTIVFAMTFMGVRLTKEEAASMANVGGSLDVLGMVGTMMFLAGVILVLSLCTSAMPFGSPLNTSCLVLAAVGLAMLIVAIKKKGSSAFIPAPVLKDRNTLMFTLSNLFHNFSVMAVFFFMPTYILYVLGGTATQASIPMTLFGVIGIFAGRYFGAMIGKSGTAKGVGIISGIARLVVYLGLALFLKPSSSVWFIYIMMFIGGVINSSSGVTFSAGPQIQIRPEIRATGNSMVQMGQNFGSSLGTAFFTMILATKGFADGMTFALIIATVLGVTASACLLFLKPLEQPAAK